MPDLPLEDQPSGAGLVPGRPEDAAAAAGRALLAPGGTAAAFLHALSDPARYLVDLRMLTTPESWPAWGDFAEAAAALGRIPAWGVGTRGRQAEGDDDVVYISVISDVDGTLRVDGDVLVNAAAILTLVRRPSRGGWVVHAFEPGYLRAEDVPHDD